MLDDFYRLGGVLLGAYGVIRCWRLARGFFS